jgi:hypothetical protein
VIACDIVLPRLEPIVKDEFPPSGRRRPQSRLTSCLRGHSLWVDRLKHHVSLASEDFTKPALLTGAGLKALAFQ